MTLASYEEIVKLQPKGVLTIPKKIRQCFGLEDKSFVRIRGEKGKIVIEPVRTLPYQVRNYTSEDLKDFFALDDKESKELRAKGLL